MLDIGLDKALSEMSIRNPSTKPDLAKLLPIRYTMGIGDFYSSVQFKNPMTNEEFEEPYRNEVSRVSAFTTINAEIKKYNDELKKHYEEIDKEVGFENRYSKTKLFPVKELSPWLYTVWCEKAQHFDHWDDTYKKSAIDVRRFTNEKLYIALQSISSDEERVIRLNRLIYDYLQAVTEGKTIVESSSLYYPLLEFEDYFMRMPSNKSFVSLLSQKPTLVVDNRPSPFEGFLYHNSNGGRTGDGRTKEISHKDFVLAHHYKLVITLNETDANGTMHIEKPYKKVGGKFKIKDGSHPHKNQKYYDNIDGRDVSGSLTFSDLNFKAPKKGLNRYIKLLIAHSYFQKLLRKADTKDETETINSYNLSIKKELKNEDTIKKYHSNLHQILKKMLCVEQVGIDVIKHRSIDFQTPMQQGGFETIKHPIYQLELPVEVRHINKNNDEGGFKRDISEDYRN